MNKDDMIVNLLLGAKGYFSGEQMARHLRISRTAVWNHIRRLRDIGFDIESQPHLGYRIAGIPDILLPALVSNGLRTKVVGGRIFHLERTGSTNDEAERLARRGEADGTVVVAEYQTAGRGRLGRVWCSPPRKGVYLSVLLRPALSPARIPVLTLCAAVSATEAIRRCSGLDASVKWPNDVLVRGRKVCGILTELATEADRIDYAILGVGVNVNCEKTDFPRGLDATSLSIELGKKVSRLTLARSLLEELDASYDLLRRGEEKEIIDRWLKVSATVGKRIRAESLAGEVWEGVATGLDEDGCLLLRLDGGLTRRLTGGDVTIL